MSISILKCQFSQMLAFRHLLYYAFPFELACILTYLFCMSNILISLLFLQIYTKRAFFFMALLFHDFIYFLLLFFFGSPPWKGCWSGRSKREERSWRNRR